MADCSLTCIVPMVWFCCINYTDRGHRGSPGQGNSWKSRSSPPPPPPHFQSNHPVFLLWFETSPLDAVRSGTWRIWWVADWECFSHITSAPGCLRQASFCTTCLDGVFGSLVLCCPPGVSPYRALALCGGLWPCLRFLFCVPGPRRPGTGMFSGQLSAAELAYPLYAAFLWFGVSKDFPNVFSVPAPHGRICDFRDHIRAQICMNICKFYCPTMYPEWISSFLDVI